MFCVIQVDTVNLSLKMQEDRKTTSEGRILPASRRLRTLAYRVRIKVVQPCELQTAVRLYSLDVSLFRSTF